MEINFIPTPESARAGKLNVMLPRQATPLAANHLTACERAAAQAGAAIVTAVYELGNTLQMAYTGPDGTFRQPACFLPQGYGHLKQGTDVAVHETAFGRLALAPAYDSLQPQYARLAALKGCQLLAACLWLPGEAVMMAGPWSAAQANCLAVAAAQPDVGNLILPCALTTDNSGLGRDVFEPAALARAYKAFPVFDCLNPAFYARYGKELAW